MAKITASGIVRGTCPEHPKCALLGGNDPDFVVHAPFAHQRKGGIPEVAAPATWSATMKQINDVDDQPMIAAIWWDVE